MKKLLLLLFLLAFAVPGFAQNNLQWNSIELTYYSGPVSPQYQYTWTATINSDRTAMFVSKGANTDTSYSFTLSRSKFNKINNYIKKYKLMTANPSDMETSQRRIGGAEYTVKMVVQNTNPNYDQPPQVITFPSQQNDAWEPKMDNVVNAIINAIPDTK